MNIQIKQILQKLLVIFVLMGSCYIFDQIYEGKDIGYTWNIIYSSSFLSLKILAVALLWSFILHSTLISLCFFRFQKEKLRILEILIQFFSGIPLFIACLYLTTHDIKANIWYAGLILSVCDFLLAEIFPLLYYKLKRIFTPAYTEAMQARGYFFPLFSVPNSWQHWKKFLQYYVLVYLREWTQIIILKIPLFFSAMIVVEKALFYGVDMQGANRGLGSLFFDCILEWSEGKNRLLPLVRLTAYSLFLLLTTSMLFQILYYILGGQPEKQKQLTQNTQKKQQKFQFSHFSFPKFRIPKIQCTRKHVVFICGLFCILFLCHISTPSNAYTLYPWWLIPTLLYIFAYIFFRYYFYKKHSLRRPFLVLFYMCDTLLFIPCTFLIYTMGVQWNIFQPPVHFEKNICQPSQMIVFQNSLFTAYTKPIIQKKQNKIDTKRTFQSWKRNFQFQLRLLERTTKTTTSLYVWLQDQKHPETQQQFENMVQELKLYYSQYAQKTKKILENKNKTWMWTAQEKSIQKYIQEFQSTDYFPIQIISKPVPPPLMQLYIKNKQLYIYWKEQNIYYKYNIPDIEYHNITYNIVGKTYTIHIHRYPGIKNIYIEQALQQAKNDTIQPIETDMPDSFTKYTNLFFRPSLLGTKGGVRNQDIFLRHVAAFQETYCKTTIPIILFLLCLLASWPILYLLPQVPKWITTLCQTITTLLKYTTAIPIYVIIAIIFIGIYDGKNFHILFTLVGYFLLPNLTQQIYRSVQTYKETYYPTKISLGFSPIMIAYHFITREARQLYIIYLLYFCANMILFETSFAYLKGGSPSELSLGIFLYASRNQWTMETYATIIILVSILYFFSRSTLFFRQENI